MAKIRCQQSMLEESQYYIEWTAAETEPEIAGELVDIQRMIALWRKAWPIAQNHHIERILLSAQAKKWSDQVLSYSGLMELGDNKLDTAHDEDGLSGLT